jgi:hypothetical protein
MPGKVDGENLGLLLRIVRIRSDRDLLISMEIVRGIVDGSLCRRLDESLAREHNRHQPSKAKDNHKPATAQSPWNPSHSAIIEGLAAERAV